jgi:hypothetical protein
LTFPAHPAKWPFRVQRTAEEIAVAPEMLKGENKANK